MDRGIVQDASRVSAAVERGAGSGFTVWPGGIREGPSENDAPAHRKSDTAKSAGKATQGLGKNRIPPSPNVSTGAAEEKGKGPLTRGYPVV